MGRYLDVGFKFCCNVVVAAILCWCRVPVALAQTKADFLNIDCGANDKYVDPLTGFTWVPDTAFVSAGKTQTTFPSTALQNITELKRLRYFDDLRPKNCYALPVTASSTYLLRLTFYYGNYDSKNQPPSFQVAIDTTILDNMTAAADTGLYAEYNYISQGNMTYVCLIRSSPQSSPFISGISLKPATGLPNGYATQYSELLKKGYIMKTLNRVNYGAAQMIRAPEDFYDRFWFAEGLTETNLLKPTSTAYKFLSTTSPFPALVDQQSYPPSAVMQTAVTSNDSITTLLLPPGSTTAETDWFVSVYYGEVLNSSGAPVPRNFSIEVMGDSRTANLDGVPGVGFYYDLVKNDVPDGPNATMTLTRLPSSPAGPILNALEIFAQSAPTLLKTIDRDALAIANIKKAWNLTAWTGDPCLPISHSWIACSSPDVTTPQPQITTVDLSGYQLEGEIPASFANLLALTNLSLSNNNLSGPLPKSLTTLKSLKVLSVQNNNLSGPIPEALLAANSPIQFTYQPGNFLLTGGGPVSAASCVDCKKKSNIAAIIGASAGGVLGLLLILVIAIFACRRCHRKVPDRSEDEGISTMRIATTGGAKAYSLAEVRDATTQFKRKLGAGGFGPVFYGIFPDGQEVAVKVASGGSQQGEKEFFNEVDVFSRVHHKNLVALVGYCQEKEPMLIYEYMHNGSLFDHLHGWISSDMPTDSNRPAWIIGFNDSTGISASSTKLDWRKRLHIGLNTAQGLEYLHTGCSSSFIHRDVKSNNILLTPKFDAKVADFGLTKFMGEAEDTRVLTNVMGTAGYLDPEYTVTNYLSSKSDVYSFGVVLLELITGRLPIDLSNAAMGKDPHIANWVRESLQNNDIDAILDPAVKALNPNMQAVWKVAEIAMQSVEPKSVHRPTMTEVVQELQGALTIEGISTPRVHSGFYSKFSDNSSKVEYGPNSFPTPR